MFVLKHKGHVIDTDIKSGNFVLEILQQSKLKQEMSCHEVFEGGSRLVACSDAFGNFRTIKGAQQ